MIDIAAQRAAVVAEAQSWLRTPFHDCAELKGVGVDCAHLVYAVYRACGIVPEIEIPAYSPQFMLHQSAEIYLGFVLKHAVEVEAPQPGDLVLWKFGRCFSHSAIVVDWPRIIHAWKPVRTVTEDDAVSASYLTHIGENVAERGRLRPRKFFTLKAWG